MLKKEIEREVLALVLVVIILVSILGTWAIVQVIDNNQATPVDNYNSGAQISLLIVPPSDTATLPSSSQEENT